MFNFIGHGGEPIPNEPFSIELFANQLADEITRRNMQPADIFGYSMGGYVATYLARTSPDLVKSVFTLGTKWKWTPEIAQREVRMLDPQKIEEKVPQFANALAKRHHPQDWHVVLRKSAEMMLTLGDKNALSPDDLKSVQQPITVALADADQMVTREETEEVASALPNGAMTIIPNSQHPIEKVDIERLILEMRRFFS